MNIRKWSGQEIKEIIGLCRQTIEEVNSREYTPEQIRAWLSGIGSEAWQAALSRQEIWIAEKEGRLAGFCTRDSHGYVDSLFVHADYQRQGIGSALCEAAEAGMKKTWAHVSLTAKPFFLSRGYRCIAKEYAERKGIQLPRFLMEKTFGE